MSSAKSIGRAKSPRRLRRKAIASVVSGEARAATPKNAPSQPLATAKRVLRIEAEAIAGLIDRLDERFERAVELLHACGGRVVVTGLGKSGLIGRKIAATFASTGSPSFFLHAAEALHGDLGMLTPSDVLLAISSSGETEELVELLEAGKRLGVPLITLTAAPASTLASASDIVLDIAVAQEACSLNLAPTASTAAALAMGDALAISLLERRGFNQDDFAALHPGGKLGKKLRRVEALMHTGENLPRVLPGAKMPDVIYEMSRKGLGLAAVTEPDGRLLGIITDGDLRRVMQKRRENVLDLAAADCLTKNPVTLPRSELAAAALRLMEEKKITAVLIVNDQKRLEGVVHIHDLWTLQLF
ncbi:MAG: KpsF/GutQ family sugar-phosphate isomerase [Candidatus Acidiferrales bacterium]|jgi:arabinose-5-phosphate isomerase